MDDAEQEKTEAKVWKEVVSHNLNFKAYIYQPTPKQIKFEASIYEWQDDENPASSAGKAPIWKRISGPHLFLDLEEAEKWVSVELPELSGEELDQHMSAEDIGWLREYSDDENAEYLKSTNFSARFLPHPDTDPESYEKLKAISIAIVHDFYLVQTKEGWLLGMLERPGHITCWQQFGTLPDALAALAKARL